MIHRRLLLIFLLLLTSCSQIEVPNEESPQQESTTGSDRNKITPQKTSVSNSSLKKYNESYNLFKVEHRNIFKQIDGNKLALRNAGERTTEAVEEMYSLLSNKAQSRVEDVLDSYVQAWENFDTKSPSVGERTRLKRAGKRVFRAFKPSTVQLRKSTSNRKPSKDTAEGTSSGDSVSERKIIIHRTSDKNKIHVENPSRYRKLFQDWRDLHEKFQNGLEASDPLLPTTYHLLGKTIKKMIEEVSSDKDKLTDYYLSQYKLIYEKREQYKGTPIKSNHLIFLKKQFIKDFSPSTSN